MKICTQHTILKVFYNLNLRLNKVVPALSLLGLLLLAAPLPLAADSLAQLPAAWQDRLQAVHETDISGTERVAREAITATRSRLAELLAGGSNDTANLAEGYAKLGALYQLFQIDSSAALCWDNARRLQPADYRWSYYAGYLALTQGQTETALSGLQRARELKPDYAPLDLRMGQLWLDINQLDQAHTALARAAEQPGLRAAALYYLGQLDLLRRDYQGAQQHLSEALELAPQATGVHYPLAQAYRHLGQTELARRHLAEFKPGLPEADDPLVAELQGVLETSHADFRLAMRAINERDDEKAIQHFRDGLEIDPDNLAARVSYARALYLGGERDAAAQELNAVLARNPQQVLASFLLAVLLQSQGKTELAAEHYRRILQLDPRHEGARFFLANLLFQQGQFAEAARQYAEALAANPDIPPARLLELVAQHRAGQPDGKIAAELERRVDAYPEQSELKYALIRLRSLSADSEVRDSVRALNLANQLAPNQPTPPNIAALALAAAADGQYEQAARLQQQAINMLVWMPAGDALQTLQDTLSAYEKGALPPQPVWPADDPLMTPPPLNPREPFRHYAAPVPF